MKKVLSLILVSALGGALTLSTYLLFFDKPQSDGIVNSNDELQVFQTSNNMTNNALPAFPRRKD